ncbi:MAG: AsmA family protein [Gammaproteobacteria bacterium]|nr:AsmA family protein [Gammaproteobacteria bacterium]MBU1644914.1 AsmA family protein [Gammaproteobacteria bacterium]MBU1971373.1 AsmA family protein [Gammaproteobacteria bacterium]
MKAMKIAAITIVALIAIVIAGVAVIMAKFDATLVKTELSKVVKEKKQRTLKIDGDLQLAFWPSLGVKVGKVSLSEHKSDKEFLALDSAHVSVAVMPLLSKQIVVDTIELAGARATLVRRKDGTLNIADLMAKDDSDSPMVKFNIAGVKITSSELAFRDEQGGANYAASGLNLSTGRLANAAEGPLDLTAKVVADKPKTALDVKVGGQYRYDLDKKSYALSRFTIAVKGEVASARKLDLDLAAYSLSLQPGSRAVAIEGLTLAAKGDVAEVQGLDLSVAATKLALTPAENRVVIEKLAATAKGKRGTDNFSVNLEAPKLSLTPEKAGGEKITLATSLSGAGKSIAARIGLSGVEGSATALKVASLELDLDAKVGETSVKGKLSSPLAVDLEATTLDLPKLTGDLDIADPKMPMRQVTLPVSGTVAADWGKQNADVQLSTQFDESKIAAKVNLAKFAPPDIGFDVDIDRLNVDKYFPPEKKAAGDKKIGAGGTAGAEEKIDLAALKSLKLHGTVKVGQLQVQNVKAANVRLNIKAAQGKLDVAPLSMNLYDGTLNGALSINANGNSVALKQKLVGVNINPLMQDALDKDLLAGRGTVNLDVTTRGETVTAMKQALAGSASLALKDGAIKGIDLAKSFRELKAKFSNKQDVVQAANATDQTDFSEMTASFRIDKGVAHNKDLAAKSPFLRLGGAGDIDIGNGRIDYLAKATVVNTSAGQGGKDLDHVKGLTVPVRLTGPFDDMSYKIELASMLQGAVKEAAKAKVEEKKEEIKAKVEDKVKDKLKGLFKR